MRPLFFRNFLSKIFRKPKMGYAPHPLRYAQHLPPSGGRLLLSCIFIMLDRSCQLSHSANSASRTQLCPVAADSAAGRQGWRSQAIGEIFKGTDGACADPDTQNFPCHGSTQHCRLPIQIQLSFTSHTGSLLLSSPKKVTFPSSPRPPSSPPFSLLHFAKFVHTRREDCTLRRGKRGIIIYA